MQTCVTTLQNIGTLNFYSRKLCLVRFCWKSVLDADPDPSFTLMRFRLFTLLRIRIRILFLVIVMRKSATTGSDPTAPFEPPPLGNFDFGADPGFCFLLRCGSGSRFSLWCWSFDLASRNEADMLVTLPMSTTSKPLNLVLVTYMCIVVRPVA
jgi:hypothetical protein